MQLAALQTFFSIRHCLLKDNNLLLNVLLIGALQANETFPQHRDFRMVLQ